jgi:MFS family permease
VSLKRSKRVGLFAACALEAMSYGGVYALLVELQRRYHLPTWGLGAIAGANFAAQLIAQLTLARFADRGHARLLLRWGLVVAAAGMAWFGLADSLWELIMARAVLGLGSGIFLPAALRVIITNAGDRDGKAIGFLTAVQFSGYAVGPPVAAGIYAVAGLRAPFLILGIALVACFPLLATVPEPPFEIHQKVQTLRVLFRIPAVRSGLAVGSAAYLVFAAFEAVWARYLTDRGGTTTTIAVSIALFAVPLILIAPLAGRVADRIGAGQAAVVGTGLLPIVLAGFAFDVPIWSIVAIAVTLGAVLAITLPAGQTAIAQGSPNELVAAGQGLYGAIGSGTAALASLCSAALYGALGSMVMWLSLAACVGSFSVLAFYWLPSRAEMKRLRSRSIV